MINPSQEHVETQARQGRANIAMKDHAYDSLREQLVNLTKEHQELMEVKVILDMEIAAYRTLLETEEARLGMSQTEVNIEAENERSKKRKRMCLEEEEECGESIVSTSFVQPHSLLIEPLVEEMSIKVSNTGKEKVSLGGYKLCCTSEGIICTDLLPCVV